MPSYISEAAQGSVTSWIKTRLPYLYDLPWTYKQDYNEILYRVVSKYLNSTDKSKYDYLIKSTFPFIRYGNYKVKYQYVLPDGTNTTNAVFEYLNPLKSN